MMKASREAATEVDQIEERLLTIDTRPSVIYSADNKLLFQVSSENRKYFRLKDVPMFVRNAFLAAEDRRFYTHPGVDAIGLARAVAVTAQGGSVQGGSTLTMQLAKQMFTGSERSMQRKLKDIALATELEKLKSKDQILELYLKQVYFGESAHGLASAAAIYFNKKIKDLTLGEAAMLARCVRRPSDENPFKDMDRAIRNRNVVLGIMLEDGLITKADYDKAKAERPKLNKNKNRTTAIMAGAPYFVDDVIRQIKEDFPDIDLKMGGYKVETTLRYDLQKIAEKAVGRVVKENRRNGVTDGAFVLMDKDGQILAMVGGKNYGEDQFNIVSQGKRQPGSSFKPYVYATALATGAINPGDYISNAVIRKPDPSSDTGWWMPKNASSRENASSYSLAHAMALSINRSAIHTMEKTGVRTVINYSRDTFGIRSPLSANLPLALGASAVSPIEMAEGYSVFMLRGDRVRPNRILRIIGPDGRVIRSYTPTKYRNVLDPGVALTMDSLLRGVVTSGTARAALDVPNAKGKTGTTSSHKDAWFCGYSNSLLGIGWVGNRENKSMSSRVFGGTVTIQFWREVMLAAHKKGLGKPIQFNVSGLADATPVEDSSDAEVWVPPVRDVPVRETSAPAVDEDPEPRRRRETPRDEPALEPAGTDAPPVDAPPVPESRPDPAPVASQPRPERREEASVSVEVCVDSGMRASMYCPEVVQRDFRRGRQPRRVCRLHGPGN
jgi:penicillin-binding protein 1A